MTDDELRVITAETGPLDDAITGVAQVADGRFAIAYGDAEIDVELAGNGGRVVITAPIGVPPENRLPAITQALLSYSALWRETGGVRAALPAAAEPALLIVDLPTDGLTPKLLTSAARDMAEKAAVWRTFLAAPAEADLVSPLPLAAMIRV